MITKEDFADTLSQDIFMFRKNFYETGDWCQLLYMSLRSHSDTVEKINNLANRFYQDMHNTKQELIIFGAGNNGKWTLHCLRRHDIAGKVAGFLDNSAEKQAVGCSDLPVYSVAHVLSNADKYLVLIPEGPYQQEMKAQLLTAGFPEMEIYVVPMLAVWQDDLKDRADLEQIFFNPLHHFVLFNTSWELQLMWRLLHPIGVKVDCFCEPHISPDENFCGLPLKSLGEVQQQTDLPYFIVMGYVPQLCLQKAGIPNEKIIRLANSAQLQYFDETVNPYRGNGQEVFIDGGVLDLESSQGFLKYCHGNCAKIYAFEPDERNMQYCRNILAHDALLAEKVELIPKGIWSEPTTLLFKGDPFNSGGSYIEEPSSNSRGYKTVGDVELECTSVDAVLQGGKATFIKFDIEGSELAGLQGARQTIEKYHPTLAISVYHKAEDIVTLPSYIKEIAPGYQFYLRCYHEDFQETVLYAIWPQ